MRRLSLRDANDLLAYWNEHPPVHELLAGFVGYQGGGPTASAGPSRPPSSAVMESSIEDLAAFGISATPRKRTPRTWNPLPIDIPGRKGVVR